MLAIVASIAEDEAEVIFAELQGGSHLVVGQGPTAVEIIEIIGSILQEYPDVLALGLADDTGVDMATADIGEAANMADDLVEIVGSLPGRCEGADSARADAGDGPHLRIVSQLVVLCHRRDDFPGKETDILVTEGVVFKASVPPGRGPFFRCGYHPGIDEDTDGDRHLARMDQVVKDHGYAELTFFVYVPFAVLEDHHRRRG